MLVLGFSGGPDLTHEDLHGLSPFALHDSACALIEDGEVLFATEEERLNRIKHTNKFPSQSMQSCLNARGVRISDIDQIAYYNTNEGIYSIGIGLFLTKLEASELSEGATLIRSLINKALNTQVNLDRLRFVHHHYAHAASAFALSGFDESLILSIDGQGDGISGMVLVGEDMAFRPIADFPISKSLGIFYVYTIYYLGFSLFDEYKVMGLAPYV